tara:strand:+ start:35 stop:295 length:261 start_codon:yes stop_codon:yes gene_type:complete
MSKRKKSAKKAKQRAEGAPLSAPAVAEETTSEAQRLFAAGDYLGARAACGENDEEIRARLTVDPVFFQIYAGGLALIGVLGALTMR